MRYAVFSDVHANLEAFQAVLAFFHKARLDTYLFLGDVVGYGADPEGCLALLKETSAVSVAGNHDYAVAGRMDTDYFNKAARAAVDWTKQKLGVADRLFLSDLELVKERPDFCLVHGTLEDPGRFDYMLDDSRARRTFGLMKTNVCFVGHSHLPGVFISDKDKISYRKPSSVELEAGKRYIVNAGSVGQPRDGDPRACCCIYDTEKNLVTFHRILYDIKEAGRKIREAGLPLSLADRLDLGR